MSIALRMEVFCDVKPNKDWRVRHHWSLQLSLWYNDDGFKLILISFYGQGPLLDTNSASLSLTSSASASLSTPPFFLPFPFAFIPLPALLRDDEKIILLESSIWLIFGKKRLILPSLSADHNRLSSKYGCLCCKQVLLHVRTFRSSVSQMGLYPPIPRFPDPPVQRRRSITDRIHSSITFCLAVIVMTQVRFPVSPLWAPLVQ